MPGMGAVWRWRNWAEEACCSLLGSQMVSTAHTCSALSGLFVARWDTSADTISPVWPAVSTLHASALTDHVHVKGEDTLNLCLPACFSCQPISFPNCCSSLLCGSDTADVLYVQMGWAPKPLSRLRLSCSPEPVLTLVGVLWPVYYDCVYHLE